MFTQANALLKQAPKQVARIQASTRSVATTTTAAAGTTTDSFAFYPVSKHSSPSVEKECFSFYPSNGQQAADQKVAKATPAVATNKEMIDFSAKESLVGDMMWHSLMEHRMMHPAKKSAKKTTTTIHQVNEEAFVAATIQESFAFYPARKATQAASTRECFSFYPSNGVDGQAMKDGEATTNDEEAFAATTNWESVMQTWKTSKATTTTTAVLP